MRFCQSKFIEHRDYTRPKVQIIYEFTGSDKIIGIQLAMKDYLYALIAESDEEYEELKNLEGVLDV